MSGIRKLVCRFVLFCVLVPGVAGYGDALATDVICCGGDEVFSIDPMDPSAKKWSWRAEDSPSIPEPFRSKFRSTDDCKPYQDGWILITSSSDGVALVERKTKKCVFLAESRNAHSACLLPNRQLAVAASYGGDEIRFYNRADVARPASPEQAIPFVGAHGVVWDPQRQCLWALGDHELALIVADDRLAPEKRWSVKSRHTLPSAGGHDLASARDGARLFVTTNTQVLLYDCDKQTFQPHSVLGSKLTVKSVDVHPKSGQLVFHQAGPEHWWSDTLRFVGSEPAVVVLPDERLYKARWDIPAPQPN